MKNDSLILFKIKKALEMLRNKRGFHTELISLYIPPERRISLSVNYLKKELAESQNIKSNQTRKNVLDSISKLLGQLKNIKKIPENGLVLFSGTMANTEKNETYIIEPLEKITHFKYLCSNEFYLDPLFKSLESKETYGLLTIGAGGASIGILKGNYIEKIKEYSSGIDSKHKSGGQSAPRFDRLRLEQEKAFHKRISEHVNEIMLEKNVSGIFIGGPSNSKLKFIKNEGLDYRLRDKILQVVDIGDDDFKGLSDLVNKIQEKITDVKFIKEKQLFDRFMKETIKENGNATYGLSEVEQALSYGAVNTLILSEELGLIEIERLGELAEQTNSKVEVLSNKTESGNILYEAFGGIVCLLRFRHQRLN